MNKTIALVEDESNIRDSVHAALSKEGYEVEAFDSGTKAWTRFETFLPDVVVLDINLPGIDGLELCRRLRSRSEAIAIIFLTSRDEEIDRIIGLELGADDYLCKPFSMRELSARIRLLFRRLALTKRPPDPVQAHHLVLRGLDLDLDRYRVTWENRMVELTITEFMLLHTLVSRPGHVKSRDQLRQGAYRYDNWVSDRTIDSHVKRLRKKFHQADSSFDEVETVYGVGYRWREGC